MPNGLLGIRHSFAGREDDSHDLRCLVFLSKVHNLDGNLGSTI